MTSKNGLKVEIGAKVRLENKFIDTEVGEVTDIDEKLEIATVIYKSEPEPYHFPNDFLYVLSKEEFILYQLEN